MADEIIPPKLFVSYSWTTPAHQKWVIDLSEQLVESGVDVILDKWYLKEGHDSYSFMEQMVTDKSVTKVIIVSDPAYARKADERRGGVGTEAQIISPEIYKNTDQDKFVVIIPEKDENGDAQVPTYFKNRIHIDFSESSKFIESFDQLLRWIYNKPLHVRPPLGKPPAFLTDEGRTRLGTEASFRRCIDAIKNNKPFASGATDEYLTEFGTNLENFRVDKKEDVPFDEIIIKSIEDFLPYRDQLIQLSVAISQYAPTLEYAQKLHRFYERLLPFMDRPEGMTSWAEDQFDNFRFVVHEAFLYTLTVFIEADRFDLADHLLKTPYYIPGRSEHGKNAVVDFRSFVSQAKSFERRNQRLKTRRYSLRADILNERSKSSGYSFSSIMQADFIVWLRSRRDTEGWGRWWPETLVHSTHAYAAFEKFARSVSKAYFDRFKVVLGVESADEFREFCETLIAQERGVPSWDFDRLDVRTLSSAETLATRP